MRLLLDHDVSGPRVGVWLTAHGHDVRPLDQEPQHAAPADDDVLRLADGEGRIAVAHDVNAFAPLLREFAERVEHHSGAVVLVGIRSREFDLIVHAIETWLLRYPQEEWRDLTLFATRGDVPHPPSAGLSASWRGQASGSAERHGDGRTTAAPVSANTSQRVTESGDDPRISIDIRVTPRPAGRAKENPGQLLARVVQPW